MSIATKVRFMVILFCGLGVIGLAADPIPPELTEADIIPKFISYSPPSGYIPNPHAPSAPQWYHPEHDRLLNEIEFTFLDTENIFGEASVDFRNQPSWKVLQEHLIDPRWPPVYKTECKLSAHIIDGRPVLILDFKNSAYPHHEDYWSMIYIPVTPHLFVMGNVSASTTALRDKLRSSFLSIRIHRYWEIPGSDAVEKADAQVKAKLPASPRLSSP
jgi:hypothetical protein